MTETVSSANFILRTFIFHNKKKSSLKVQGASDCRHGDRHGGQTWGRFVCLVLEVLKSGFVKSDDRFFCGRLRIGTGAIIIQGHIGKHIKIFFFNPNFTKT